MTKSSKGHASKGLWGMHLDVLRGTSDKLVCLLLPDGSMEMFGEGKTVADILAAYPGYHVGSLTSSRPRLAPQKALHPGSTYYLTPDLTPGVAAAASRGNGPFSPGVTREGVTPHLRRESATYLRTAEEFGDVANDVAWLREERPPARRVSLDPGSLQRHASRTTGARQIPSGDLFTGRDPFTGLATTHEESQSQPAQVSASMVRAALTGSRMHACEEEQPGSYVELGRNVPVCGNIACQAPECNPNMLADSSGGAATFPDFAGCYNIDERVCDTRRVVRKVPALHSELNFRESCREWEPIRPATSNPPDRSPEPYINATAAYHSQPFPQLPAPYHTTASPGLISSRRKNLNFHEQPISHNGIISRVVNLASCEPSSGFGFSGSLISSGVSTSGGAGSCGGSSRFSVPSVPSSIVSRSPSASSSASFSVFSSSSTIQLSGQEP